MRITTILCVAVLTALAGCSRESPHGGPGALPARNDAVRAPDPVYPPGETLDASKTFTVSVPSSETEVTQGDVEEFTISVNRGRNFDENVRLKVKAPSGITVTPSTTTIPRDMQDVKVAVAAAPDAPLGRATLEVIGTPETGQAVAVHLEVDVKRR